MEGHYEVQGKQQLVHSQHEKVCVCIREGEVWSWVAGGEGVAGCLNDREKERVGEQREP